MWEIKIRITIITLITFCAVNALMRRPVNIFFQNIIRLLTNHAAFQKYECTVMFGSIGSQKCLADFM